MRSLLKILAAAVGLAPASGFAETMHILDRDVEVYAPASTKNAPILILLHGGGGFGRQISRNSRLDKLAPNAGFILAAPNGTGLVPTWNAGFCCGAAQRKDARDTEYLSALIHALQEATGTSSEDVFLAGMSNGGMMAQTFAALRLDSLTAIAAVSSSFSPEKTPPSGPLPVLRIHGLEDANVPLDGGLGIGLARISFPSFAEGTMAWMAVNNLSAQEPSISKVKGYVIESWSQGGRPILKNIFVQSGEHSWFGGKRGPRSGSDPDASAEILDFFSSWVNP